MKRFAILIGALATAIVGILIFANVLSTSAQANVPCYRLQRGAKAIAGSGCEYEFLSGSILDVQSGTTFTADDLTLADDLNVADIIASTYTTVTVTPGSTIIPTGVYQILTSATAAGTSSIANPTAGRFVVLVNVGSNTITLTDTGTLKLSGNIALGQYDSVSLLGDGTNWVQTATSNN